MLNYTTICKRSCKGSAVKRKCCCLAISIPEWVLIMGPGPPAWEDADLEKRMKNGQRLRELCTFNCTTSASRTLFQTNPQLSWRHPRSKHWHQLDMIITRREHLMNVLITCSYHSADYITDHALVCCKIRVRPKKLHHTKPTGKSRINAINNSHPGLR